MPSPTRLLVVALFLLLGCGTSTVAPSPDSGASGGEDGSSGGGSTDGPSGGSSSGGGAIDGGGPGICLTGTVSFELNLGTGATGSKYCLGPPGSCTGGEWLSILSADGGTSFSQVMGCVPTCSDCQPVACSNLCIITPALGDAGAHTTWDGTYLEHTTCGASVSCTNQKCAPAGDYIARMCGFPENVDASFGAECQGSTTPTCIDVPFVWPPPSGTSVVQGDLGGSADAGTSD
jgi:hypothetical protein